MATKFTGKVNGKVFDNHDEFTKYLQKLIDENETNIQVSSEEVTVKDEDENPKCSKIDLSGGYFPFFEENDEYYLDDESYSLDSAKMRFDNFMKNLDQKIKDLCPRSLCDYSNAIDDIKDLIIGDETFAQAEIDKFSNLIKKTQTDLDSYVSSRNRMMDFRDKITLFKKFYNELDQAVSDAYNKKKEEHNCGEKCCKCDEKCCKCEEPDKPEKVPSVKQNLIDGYMRLLKAVLKD